MLADYCAAGVSLYLLLLLRKISICGIIILKLYLEYWDI